MAKNLTEKQQAFIDALFNEAEGNPVMALKRLSNGPHTVRLA